MDILTTTLKALEFDKIQQKLSGFAKTKQSSDLCKKLILCNEIDAIKKQLQYTKDAKRILDDAQDLPIEFIVDLSKINLNCSYFTEQEIIDIAKTLKTSRIVKKNLNMNTKSSLCELSDKLFTDKVLEDKIFSTFDDALNIKHDATNELKSLFASLKDNEKNLKLKVNELLTSPNFSKHLQENIYTTRDDRIVFQVMASSKNKIP